MKTEILIATNDNIELAARALVDGELVAFPTETVYGLGANALIPDSVKRIYAAKGRPSDNPLIVHLGDKAQIEEYAFVSDQARTLIDAFMPGALTLLLKKRACIPDVVTAGRDTVGIRLPSHEVAKSFLRVASVPVCAPSANTSTRPSPTIAKHVYDDLNGRLKYIIDGGSCQIGIESTILDMSKNEAVLLRKGGISAQQIEAVLNRRIIVSDQLSEALSPGLKYKHYSPKAKVILVNNSPHSTKLINDLYIKQCALGCKTAILCYNNQVINYPSGAAVAMGDSAADYAKDFYAQLRRLDEENYSVIILQAPEQTGIGCALFNRMFKSAACQIYDEQNN